MARKSIVSKSIYRKHIALYRYINNAWIFAELIEPDLKERAKDFRESSSATKRRYRAPKKSGWTYSGRRDADIGQLFQAQHERGIYETNIVSIVSRTEAFIQDCVATVACRYPNKLSILADKGGVPINLVLENEDRSDLIKRFVSLKCEGLMFAKPKDYLNKASEVLAIELSSDVIDAYIEVKASRDIVVHGGGVANKLYVEKAGKAARSAEGEDLPIDRQYFKSVAVNIKRLSGEIQKKTEEVYK
ncbi:hypothetical protein KUV51_03080 [Tateyamaria omphalii]|uniref:hypothetical protein n=1 Tax=Tateyamaria omphalii TaxID=299262 RepID=UPI001C99F6A3|nr:hypothetical protein [Tateyamaria omphalii]MBY5931973.1 hypothetical protein [Tateyamaria omphalii]